MKVSVLASWSESGAPGSWERPAQLGSRKASQAGGVRGHSLEVGVQDGGLSLDRTEGKLA